jgi:hypothetical protein
MLKWKAIRRRRRRRRRPSAWVIINYTYQNTPNYNIVMDVSREAKARHRAVAP